MKLLLCELITLICFLIIGQLNGYNDDIIEYDDYEDFSQINSTNINGTLFFTKELINITKNSGTKVKLICEVQNLDPNNTKVIFYWLKNHGIIDKDKRIFINSKQINKHTTVSVLRINKLEDLDKSQYDCVASNGQDKIRSQAVLDVITERYVGTPFKFEPTIDEITTRIPNAAAIFDPTNINDNTVKLKSTQFDLTLTGKLPTPTYNVSESFCQKYIGTTCKQYLQNNYVFVQPPYTQKDIERKLSDAFLVISQSNDISSSCNRFAQPSLCFSAFPLCVEPKIINNYQKRNLQHLKNGQISFNTIRTILTHSLRRICKDDCLLLETELCSKEYAIAKRHPVIGQTLQLEECQYLPDNNKDTNNNNNNNWPSCLSLGVNSQQNIDVTDDCYWDKGELYRGIQNLSLNGKNCIRWSHQFLIPLSDYPELSGHNYCRNPGGVESQPFCFIDQNTKEICPISDCVKVIGIYAGGLFLLITLLLIFILMIVYCKRDKKQSPRNIQLMNLSVDKNIYGNPGPNSPGVELNSLLPLTHHGQGGPHLLQQSNQHRNHTNKINYQNVPQYTYKELTFIDELGEGAFGKVYKGELKTKLNGKIMVAVKSLKENANAKTQADFQREIELISELKHPNIICLMGVIIKKEPMCMLFEFMSEGDLHEFLITNSPDNDKYLTQTQFLHISIQIAQGMEYLSDNHYVHRDLAARNCLVSKDLIVKISDFGLSRDMYSCDYYRVQSKSLLPVRWMPPESILYGKFTTESDVWSYGVVLWEIYSYGLQPYYGYNNQEVINMIRSRKLLPCPESCPSYLYSLMIECWAELAIRRPSFAEITHRLRVWKQNGNNVTGAYFKTTQQQLTNKNNTWERTTTTTPGAAAAGATIITTTTTTSTPGISTQTTSTIKAESQSSLTSRSSSLGNKTQSTNLSGNEINSNKRRNNNKKQQQQQQHNNDDLTTMHLKNTIVNSNGDNFEIKITH